MKRRTLLCLSIALAGCATSGEREFPAAWQHAANLRIAVVEISSPVKVEDLRDLFDLSKGDSDREIREAQDRFSALEIYAKDQLTEDLRAEGFEVVRDVAAADATLRFRITDIGRSPRAWKGWYIAWEATSTLAIAALAYAKPAARPIAGAYLLEESAEEIVEGYAGFWALDRSCGPVRIEATLIDSRAGIDLWHESHTGMAGFRWRNLFHRPRGEEQDEQLRTSIRRAAKHFAEKLKAATSSVEH